MENLAIIPARGGSKGIPRKNLRLLAGKPLVAHAIEAASRASCVSRVVVSTDDPEIGGVARASGAEVVWRPSEMSGDAAASELALLHVLAHLEGTEGYVPDLLVFLQCTSPLTVPDDIDGTVETLLKEGADSALTVSPFHRFLWRHDESQRSAVGINHDRRVRLRRQEREPELLETGAVYVMRADGFRRAQHRFFGKTAMYIVPPERSLEIDELGDLLMAEALLRERLQAEKMALLPQQVEALVLDFDGVLTDNGVWVFADGSEAVKANRSDGMGIARVKAKRIPVMVLSSESNPVVQARCRKLQVECLSGLQDKREALAEWLKGRGIGPDTVVYVGNDVNDLSCLTFVGCGVAVRDAHPRVLAAARLVLDARGGMGAVREICDLVEQQRESGSWAGR